MSYRLSSKKRQQRKNFWLKFFVALVAFFIAGGLFTLLGGTITSLGSGLVSATDGTKDLVFGASVNKQELIESYKVLEQERDELKANSVAFISLRERNEELLRLLGRGGDITKVAAGVIKKPPFSPYDIYTLDAGVQDGVAVGNLVLFSDFVALGRIGRSNGTGSKVTLFSAPQNTTLMNLRSITFEAIGQGGGTIRIDAPRDFEVEPGDAITLPGYGVYVTGIVSEVVFKPQDSFKKVLAKVPVNIESVEVVSMVPYVTKISDEITEISDTE